MQFLKDAHLNVKHHFEKGGKLEFFYPLWEAQFTGLFTPGEVTRTASHVRDGIDNKRLMITVVFALLPCMGMAITGPVPSPRPRTIGRIRGLRPSPRISGGSGAIHRVGTGQGPMRWSRTRWRSPLTCGMAIAVR